MRAKVASKAKGHVYEDRFMNLDGIKLVVAYRQAQKEEEREWETIKTLFEAGFTRLENNFKVLNILTNPDLWFQYEQEQKLQELRAEVKVEEFPQIWEDLMKVIPQEVIAEAPKSDPFAYIPKLDKSVEEMITGFFPRRSQEKEGG